MLDAYDMQMLDYTNDLDIQMHPSSSEQWFQDESKMEEDGPQTPMKPENHSQTQKTDGHLLMKIEPFLREKADATIEVDMESYETNVEYEMLDDEERKALGTELLDVDLYDVSNVHFPSMLDADALDLENHNLDKGDITALSPSYKDLPITSPHLHHETSELSELQREPQPSELHPHKDTELDLAVSNSGTADGSVQEASFQDTLDDHEERRQSDDRPFGSEEVSPSGDASSESIDPTTTEESGQDSLYLPIQSGGNLHSPLPGTSELAGDSTIPVNPSGDPHEISEGVYIDPPPPVLLSMAPAEDFDFSFFNEATEWTHNDPSSPRVVHVVLQRCPTLYYEPLSSVFEALRQDEFAQSISNVTEVELILDAIDLELSITEDNLYAREISLHDLNILHDALGFGGPLRMRLKFTSPRFIVRYHVLQDQINKLHLELQNFPSSGEEVAEEKDEEVGPPVIRGENLEDNENEPIKETDHDNILQNTTQEVVSEVLATVIVDGQYDQVLSQPPLPEPNEELNEQSDLQHSTDKDASEESPVDPLTPSDQDVNNIHPTDVHSRSSEADSSSENGKIISLDIVEAEWDRESDGGESEHVDDEHVESEHIEGEHVESEHVEGEHVESEHVEGENSSEDVGHSSQVVVSSIHANKEEQALKDMSLSYLHIEVTEQDEPPKTWKDHDEVDHANTTLSEGDELHTYNLDTFDEQESVSQLENEGIGNREDYGDLLELPTDPINFEGENWDDDQDGEGEIDVNWDLENEISLSNSNHSSVTLSSKASKRSFDEIDSVGDEDGHSDGTLSPTSTGQKRSRTQ